MGGGASAETILQSRRRHGQGLLDRNLSCYHNPRDARGGRQIAGAAISAAGGRSIVRGPPSKTFEAGLDLRTVVIEFDSVASAAAAYESPAYQACLKVLGDAAVRDIRIVEGVA